MADFLKFINELTVNGKPVEEDDDDDYTAPTEEENEENKPDLDLDPSGTDNKEEDNNEDIADDDDDYTAIPEDDNNEEENSDADTEPASGENDLNLDPSGTDTNEENPDISDAEPAAENPDTDTEPTSGENDLNLDPSGENDGNTTKENPDAEPSTGENDAGLDMDTDGDSETEDDDYTASGDEGGEDSTDTTADTENDDTSDEDTSSSDSNELEAKIKQTEAEIFNTLSDDEKAIKNRQLIDSFIDLKKIVKVFLEKVQTITITEENEKILTFVEVSLLDMNNMIADYIITRYNKKSYIENFITYQQFILTVEQLKEIISKINIEEESK